MRRRAVALVAVAVVAALAGCSDADPATDSDAASDVASESAQTVRLVIPDGNVRPPDVPCTGSGGFRYAHPEASYVIEDSAGQVVASGSLPQGTSEKAWNVDLGDRRQPTVCVMMLEVAGLESVTGHTLAIDGHSPKRIRPNRSLDGIPEVVLR